MPVIDFTNPVMELVALVLFLLCLFLGKNSKNNTAVCIALLCFITILVGHTIEITYAEETEAILKLIKCVIVDETFTLVSFLSFIWIDKIQSEEMKKEGKLTRNEVKDDGLGILWKKV